MSTIDDVPLLPCVGRVLLVAVDHLALPRQRALHKGALLLVELAQHAEHGTLVDHATALSPAAGVAGPLPPRADVGNGAAGRRHWLARDGVVLVRLAIVVVVVGGVIVVVVVVAVVLLLGTGSGNGHGSRARHGGLYSHSSRHGGPGRVR